MKPSQAASMLEIGASTIRAWSVEFGQYLSPTGAGGDKRFRDFTPRDLEILSLIKGMKFSGRSGAEVHSALKVLQANDWDNLPEIPDAPMNTGNFPTVPTVAADMVLDTERKALMREIGNLRERLDELQARDDAKTEEIKDLIRRTAEAETLVRLYEEGRLQPKRGGDHKEG